MKRILFSLALGMAMVANAETSNADEVFNKMNPDKKNVAYAAFGFDPGFVVGTGYGRGFHIKPINRILGLTMDVTFPLFLFDFKHYKLDIGSRIAFFDSKWNIINRFSIINKGTSNEVYQGNLLAIEEGLLGGYFSDKWFVAIEANYEKFLLTHMKHTDYYKHIYPGVKDGWYSSTGGKWRFALQAGYTFKEVVEPAIRIGTYWHERFSKPAMTMPIFAEVTVNIHF